MPLASGTRLGPYEIVSLLGAGGMGEVYRARDTRLDRTVAIKVLPSEISAQEDLRQRFEREARVISSLNHPHICVLHDVGRQDGVDYLVMEYLEGETLAKRLTKGPLPLEQVLEYAAQTADALDKAHRQGVVHRDLKPANIMLTKSGVKLLDFGLAKLRPPEAAVGGLTALPTEQKSLTAEGTILGTLQYMAPEQLEGEEADARTDIFALGALIYEMATAKKAFEGKSQASLIAKILGSDPAPMTTMQPMTPPALDRAMQNCLAKEPDERWQTAHDVLLELKWIAEAGSQVGIPAPVVARRKSREWLMRALMAVLFLVALGLAVVHFGEVLEEKHGTRFLVSPGEEIDFRPWDLPVISPDGRLLAFTGASEGKELLWVRPMDSLGAQPLPGTEEAYSPFWSPDSRFIGFFAGGKLKKVEASGGPVLTLCDAPSSRGGTWNGNGVIVFAPTPTDGLYRVPESGGEATPVTTLEKSAGERTHRWPHFLPDGHHFLYAVDAEQSGQSGIYLGSLDSKEVTRLLDDYSSPGYTPPGYLLFVRQGTLMAQPFDTKDLTITNQAFPVAEQQVGFLLGRFSASQNGALAYFASTSANSQLVWFDRQGKQLGRVGEPGEYVQIVLSPDEKRVAVALVDPQSGNADIWLVELSSSIFSRFTFDPSRDGDPVWSPDGRQLVFQSARKGRPDLFQKLVGGGQEEVLFESNENKYPEDWSSDGRFIVFISINGRTVHALPLSGDQEPMRVLETPFDKDEFHFSPDGRWIAYNSDESGRWEVYVASFPDFTEKRQVSNSGGVQALWRKDGKELFYLGLDGKLRAVAVKAGSSLETGIPQVLFETKVRVSPIWDQYCVTGDGQRFLINEPAEDVSSPITVVLNWTAELNQ
ncbi:protein kinase [Acidobacteria bacterium AH-259-G07]|nr:protein kinase [Acidobacteria bacterium AH-259-G07]